MRPLLSIKPLAAGILGLGLALTLAGRSPAQAPTDPAGTAPGATTGTTPGGTAGTAPAATGTTAGTDLRTTTTQDNTDYGFDPGWLGLLGLAGLAGLLRKNDHTHHRTDDTTTRRTS